MTNLITCPSGLSGRLRSMKIGEERALSDRRLAKSGALVDHLLGACWTETADSGPYDFGDKSIDWAKVLQGDRFYALLQLRVLTYGPEYAFTVTCGEKACRERIEWELDLNDLPVRPLSAESREAFLAGNRFETVLPESGKRVWFRLLTGADERALPRLTRADGDRPLSGLLAFRVSEIEGVEPRDKQRFLEDLPMRDAVFLLSEFDRVDCGVETAIDIQCPVCGAVQEVELPFERSFLLPLKKPTRRPGRTSSSRP